MREDLPTLAGRFAEAGYDTVSIAANGWLRPELGLTRGFADARRLKTDARVVDAALELLSEPREKPLFLFINLFEPHGPFNVTGAPWVQERREELVPKTAPAWVRPYLALDPWGVDLRNRDQGHHLKAVNRFLLGRLEIPPEGFELLLSLYDGEVAIADHRFGQIFERWAETHGNDSIVVITSDHGELFGEHGLIEHRGSVYPELTHVPLVIAAPGRLPAGVRIQTPVQLEDLYPTLLELSGIDELPRSLLPIVHGEPRPGPITAAAWPDTFWARLIGGRLEHVWRLYREENDALVTSSGGDVELYDVAADPRMIRDLSGQRPERVTELLQKSNRYLAGLADVETQKVVFPEETKERLAALGYAVE
jgi:arylsulfatase A-like enzyme